MALRSVLRVARSASRRSMFCPLLLRGSHRRTRRAPALRLSALLTADAHGEAQPSQRQRGKQGSGRRRSRSSILVRGSLQPLVAVWSGSRRGWSLTRGYNQGVKSELLPGQDLIEAGLRDVERGRESVPALLVSVGAPRLRRLGFRIPHAITSPERRLYDLLARDNSDTAHSRYNALIRRLVSFERAAECAR